MRFGFGSLERRRHQSRSSAESGLALARPGPRLEERCTRESLSVLIEGRLSSANGRAALLKLATRLIVEEALEAESHDAAGRDY